METTMEIKVEVGHDAQAWKARAELVKPRASNISGEAYSTRPEMAVMLAMEQLFESWKGLLKG